MILVNDIPYLVDFGPGVVRRASQMSTNYGGPFDGMNIENLNHAFLTHLHSDHTAGYPDLILTPWVIGRNQPLKVFGPEGTNNMTTYILKAYEPDIDYRIYGRQPANNQGWRVESTEITEEGLVFEDENVRVEAFPVIHGSWPNAWGYRFTTPDRVIVISGDTTPSEKIIQYAKNADILVHEVYSKQKFELKDDFWKNYHADNHTSTVELGEIATLAGVKKLVLYHILNWGATEEEMLKEVKSTYSGKIHYGRDLDIY